MTYKYIKMSSFKSSENIQKKEGGPDRSVSDKSDKTKNLCFAYSKDLDHFGQSNQFSMAT